jgi:hypothetical protein
MLPPMPLYGPDRRCSFRKQQSQQASVTTKEMTSLLRIILCCPLCYGGCVYTTLSHVMQVG